MKTREEVLKEAERLSNAEIEITGPGVVSKKSADIVKSPAAKIQVDAFKHRSREKSAA